MPKYYFTKTGVERTLRKKEELKNNLKFIQGQKGEAAEVGGNQWHDNFSFEELCRQEQIANKKISDINEHIANMIQVDPPRDCQKLTIGHLAHLDIDGVEQVVLVGGFEDTDTKVSPKVLSYNAPLIVQLMGQEEGFEAKVQLDRVKTIVLTKIELPAREG